MTDNTLYAFKHGTVREMETCLNKIGYKTTISNHQVAVNLRQFPPVGVEYFLCRKPDRGFNVAFRVPNEAILITADETILGEL